MQLRLIIALIVSMAVSNKSFTQSSLSDLTSTWIKYQLGSAGSIKLPTYVRPLSSLQNKIANGISKELDLEKSEYSFNLQADSSLDAAHRSDFFVLTATSVDSDELSQDNLFLIRSDNSFISQLGEVQRQTISDKFGKLDGKVIKSYTPEFVYHFQLESVKSYTSIKTKFIVEFPLWKEPLAYFVFLVPNGEKSVLFEGMFPVYDSEFWYNEVKSMLDEFTLNSTSE